MDIKDTPNTRLEYFIKEHFKNKSRAAEAFGITRGHMSNITKGGRTLNGEIILLVGKCIPKANLDWLVHGRGTPYFEEETARYGLEMSVSVANESASAGYGAGPLTAAEVRAVRSLLSALRGE